MRAASMPALAHSPTASAYIAWPTPTMIWLIILAPRPLPTGPMRVQRAEMSRNSGARRSRSASSPPAMTVSEPAAEAGRPPPLARRPPCLYTGSARRLQALGRDVVGGDLPAESCEPRAHRSAHEPDADISEGEGFRCHGAT